MQKKRLVGAAALSAALAGGGVAGALLGAPGISWAQESSSTDDTAPESTESPATSDAPESGRFRHHGPCGGVDLNDAAEALGLTADELRTELADGATIADVAAEQGVDVQEVIDALVAAATERIDQAVTDGDLTSEEADERKAGLEDRITDFVNQTLPEEAGRFRSHVGFPGPVSFEAAAEALGLTTDELRTELADGASIADVAAEQGVDVQEVIDALVAAATERIDQAVTDGDLTSEEADERKADLEDRIADFVNQTLPGPHREFGRGGFRGGPPPWAPPAA